MEDWWWWKAKPDQNASSTFLNASFNSIKRWYKVQSRTSLNLKWLKEKQKNLNSKMNASETSDEEEEDDDDEEEIMWI